IYLIGITWGASVCLWLRLTYLPATASSRQPPHIEPTAAPTWLSAPLGAPSLLSASQPLARPPSPPVGALQEPIPVAARLSSPRLMASMMLLCGWWALLGGALPATRRYTAILDSPDPLFTLEAVRTNASPTQI